MKGVIKTFLPEKRYGFIHGEDGKDYFFHISGFCERQHPKEISEGSEVTFEQIATPKGYQAREIQFLVTHQVDTYIVPDGFIAARSVKVGAWPAVEQGEWLVHGSSQESPDEAKREAIERAKALGANALLGLEYYKSTGQNGNYRFTVHHFKGRPAVLAKKHTEGQYAKEELQGLNEAAGALKSDLVAQSKKSRLKRNLILSILILIGVALWLSPVSMTAQVLATFGLVVLAIVLGRATDYDRWLEFSPPTQTK